MRILLLCLLSILTVELSAQQLPLFSQYREYHSYINPASVNSDFLRAEYNTSIGLSHRSQWIGQPGTPKTQLLRGEYIVPDGNWLMGGTIINDQAGPVGLTGAYARIGGIVTDDIYSRGLVMGISAGAVQHRILGSRIQLLEQGDALDGIDQSRIIPDFGVGLYYYTTIGRNDNYIYGGVSLPQVLGLDLTYKTTLGQFEMHRVWHYYGVAGAYLFVGNSSYIEPSIWVRYVDGAPINVDMNIRFQADDIIWLGVGIGLNQSFNLEAGVLIGEKIGWDANEIKVGYSGGRSVHEFGPDFGFTHEINVTYLIDTAY